MKTTVSLLRAAILGTLCAVAAQAQGPNMSFFITSAGPGEGAKLGGLAGADAHCERLAEAAGAGAKTWRAYLSASAAGGQPAVNARDRIGDGPWQNAKGVQVAANVDDLHSANNKLGKENSLTEKGAVVNGRGDNPNMHDILTGSQTDGTAFADGMDHTCANWTSSAATAARRSAITTGRAAAPILRRGTRRTPRAGAARRICKARAATASSTASLPIDALIDSADRRR